MPPAPAGNSEGGTRCRECASAILRLGARRQHQSVGPAGDAVPAAEADAGADRGRVHVGRFRIVSDHRNFAGAGARCPSGPVWRRPVAQWLAALVAYGLVFVAPPFALLGLHLVLGRRFEGRMESIRKKLERTGQEAVLWIIGIVGFYLVLDALIYFDFFGLAEVTLADG